MFCNLVNHNSRRPLSPSQFFGHNIFYTWAMFMVEICTRKMRYVKLYFFYSLRYVKLSINLEVNQFIDFMVVFTLFIEKSTQVTTYIHMHPNFFSIIIRIYPYMHIAIIISCQTLVRLIIHSV